MSMEIDYKVLTQELVSDSSGVVDCQGSIFKGRHITFLIHFVYAKLELKLKGTSGYMTTPLTQKIIET